MISAHDRARLLARLARYRELFPAEDDAAARVQALVETHDDCLLRTCVPGHVTASAFVLDATRTQFLLTHHRKLDRWLQVGGHVDGEADARAAALREAREESGMVEFTVVAPDLDPGVPLDVDVHPIPARGSEPRHEHHDLRYLLIAGRGQDLVLSDESHALRWFPLAEFERVLTEANLLRLARKARQLIG
jgi:8-oxo-dGTP pyrophosphatase MutT (NUDIX family)